MSSVTRVPETRTLTGKELGGEAAWQTVRVNRRTILVEGFVRFRYGDGFSHSRALGLQLSLAFLPLVIALVGLADSLYYERMGTVLRLTLLSLTPGASDSMVRNALDHSPQGGEGGEVALWFGLIVAVIAMTTAMGQVERGANRIYGIQRDRPTREKYGRGLVMAFASGFPVLGGFLLLIAGPTFGEAVESVYRVDDDFITVIALPLGVVLLLTAITAMLRFAPRRKQPGWSWLALGSGVGLMLWLIFTGLVGAYLTFSQSLGTVYGPLTGVIVLLLWAQLTSVAIFLGMALSAQAEAEYAGVHDGAIDDPEISPDDPEG